MFRRITADEKIAVDPALKLSARSRRLADAKAHATYHFETTRDAFFANETAFLQRGIDVAQSMGSTPITRSCATSRLPCATCGTTASLSCTTVTPERHGRLPRDVARRLSRAEPLVEPRLVARLERRCLEGDRPPAQHPRRPANRGAEVRFWRRALTKGSSRVRLSYSLAQIEALNYADLAADRDRLLNLKPPAYLSEFLHT